MLYKTKYAEQGQTVHNSTRDRKENRVQLLYKTALETIGRERYWEKQKDIPKQTFIRISVQRSIYE